MMRADLDGFSKRVAAAFEAAGRGTSQALIDLVQFFHTVLKYPEFFRQKLSAGSNHHLPWAGDCANLIILPAEGISYSAGREHLPAVIAGKWHGILDNEQAKGISWKNHLQSHDWAVGVAGGDSSVEKGGSDGLLLIAPIAVGGRTFPVVAGWGVRRSNDAYQQPWVVQGDSVLHEVDYRRLAPQLRSAFEPVRDHQTYRKATRKRLQEALVAVAVHRPKAQSVILAAPFIPAPRPFCNITP